MTGWPATDLYETDDAYVLLADLPGVAPQDVELRVEDHELVFCGLRSTGVAHPGRGIVIERSWGRFCRRFSLEHPIDPERVEHGYENGIYWARLPKRHGSKAGRLPKS